MRNTVRLILILFLGLLILLNYNSIRVLNVALKFLNKDLNQRTTLIAGEISTDLQERIGSIRDNKTQIENFLRSQMNRYGVNAILFYDSSGKSEVAVSN